MHLSKVLSFFTFPLFSVCALACSSQGMSKEEEHDHEETSHHSHDGTFEMDLSEIKKFGIEFDSVKGAPFSEVIKVSGEIEPAASDLSVLTARKSGVFTPSPGITPGATVKKGSVIGYISSEGIQGGNEAAAAKANLEAAKKEYERLKPLFKEGLVTASVFNDAERAYQEAKALSSPGLSENKISVISPSSGVISSLSVSSGQFVETGTNIATISKNSGLTLRADLPARFSSKLGNIVSANFRPENSDSTFSLSALDGRKISGSFNVNNTTGYIPVYFSFNGNPSALSGNFAEVYLLGTVLPDIISIPQEALIEIQGNYYAYVVHHGHAFEKRLVRTGSTDGKRIEVIEGILPGELIVSKGASVIRMAETSAIAPPSHSHNH